MFNRDGIFGKKEDNMRKDNRNVNLTPSLQTPPPAGRTSPPDTPSKQSMPFRRQPIAPASGPALLLNWGRAAKAIALVHGGTSGRKITFDGGDCGEGGMPRSHWLVKQMGNHNCQRRTGTGCLRPATSFPFSPAGWERASFSGLANHSSPGGMGREFQAGLAWPHAPADGGRADGSGRRVAEDGYAQPVVPRRGPSGLWVVGRDFRESFSGRPREFLGAPMTPRGPIGRLSFITLQ
jgi:hypothetical protein